MKINEYIEHTNLKPTATKKDIEKLCLEAKENGFACVCVNPCNVALAKKLLDGSTVKVCTVIGFPLGQNTTQSKVAEAKDALKNGSDEFDMVINVGALKDKNYEYVRSEIAAVVNAVGGKTVKVIIETGLLSDDEKAVATGLVCEAKAHFVKTCTGFSDGVATAYDVEILKSNIKGDVKIKASAGIKTSEVALSLIKAGADRLGTSSGVQIISGLKN